MATICLGDTIEAQNGLDRQVAGLPGLPGSSPNAGLPGLPDCQAQAWMPGSSLDARPTRLPGSSLDARLKLGCQACLIARPHPLHDNCTRPLHLKSELISSVCHLCTYKVSVDVPY